MIVKIDADTKNQDWVKKSWSLPVYKSPLFFAVWGKRPLAQFRKLPVYFFAVQEGLIVNDEWAGG